MLKETSASVVPVPLISVTDAESAIRNAGRMVREYPRPAQRALRMRAIILMGLTVRAAFNACDPGDFEKLLTAIVDGLVPQAPEDLRRF